MCLDKEGLNEGRFPKEPQSCQPSNPKVVALYASMKGGSRKNRNQSEYRQEVVLLYLPQ